MSTCIVTGSLGLVGSHAVAFFADKFDKIIGIDNDQRKEFFGTSGVGNMPTVENYQHIDLDIRKINPDIFTEDVQLIIHAAGQPSHDWATENVLDDFAINAIGTVCLLEIVRKKCPAAVFIFCSTNKVYGDGTNTDYYVESEKRFLSLRTGYNEYLETDNVLHSFFGCSKLAADLYAQEYGKHLGIKTGIFRAGCITGPGHGGAVLHGFLSYLVKCFKEDLCYTIYGYGGKQVRDQIHAYDLVTAFYEFYKNPKPGEVYNIGGGTHSNCSVLEAIELCEEISGKKLNYSISDKVRTGDHKWWISDVSKRLGKREARDFYFTYSVLFIMQNGFWMITLIQYVKSAPVAVNFMRC